MNEGKFVLLWKKYLPLMRILLKKSLNEQQQVLLNKMEFESVDNRKNANYSFNVRIVNGRVENGIGSPAIGKDLFSVLAADSVVKNFMLDKAITISMERNTTISLKADPLLVEKAEAESEG